MDYQPQHFQSPEGIALVVIAKSDYDRLRALDMDEDAADKALARVALADDARYPDEVVGMMLDGKSALAAWRKYKGLSQAALAKAADVSQPAIARLEGGKVVFGRDKTRKAIARALDIPLSALESLIE